MLLPDRITIPQPYRVNYCSKHGQIDVRYVRPPYTLLQPLTTPHNPLQPLTTYNPSQAIEYMEAHTILAPSDVVTEVERCDWPPLEPGTH